MGNTVLASKSPRRKELLKLIFDEFLISPDESEENADSNLLPEEYVMRLAEDKCINVSENFPDDTIVIGADTVVVKYGEILGKPKDKEEAKRMLNFLKNSIHSVYTGVSVINKKQNKLITFFEKTDVYFYDITDDEIDEYVNSKEPMDKAGAYGIQEKGALFVKKIDGDYNNVVGLPVSRLYKILKENFNI